MDFKELARQLRKPEGEFGKQVAINMNTGNALLYKRSIAMLQLNPDDHTLEIGMGNGVLVKDFFAKENSIRYTGCDFSEIMVDEATFFNKDLIESGKVRFIMAPLKQLPFANGSFDSVFTVNTIYFWDDPEKELGEIKRVLKKNGRLLIGLRPASVMKLMPFSAHNFQLYDQKEISDLLTKNGFIIKETSEEDEPDQEIKGARITMKTLVISAAIP